MLLEVNRSVSRKWAKDIYQQRHSISPHHRCASFSQASIWWALEGFYQQTHCGPFTPFTISANTFFLCAVSTFCRQTMPPYGSKCTTSSIWQPEQEWFWLILEIPRWPSIHHPCLSSLCVLKKHTVFLQGSPCRNSGAQAVHINYLGRPGNEATSTIPIR